MAKYKIGQKVRLRGDLIYNKRYGSHWVNDGIYNLKGKFVTITKVAEVFGETIYTMRELSIYTGVTELMIDPHSSLLNFLKELQCTK